MACGIASSLHGRLEPCVVRESAVAAVPREFSMIETVPSICRTCLAFCPILVTVEDGRAVSVTGDPGVALYEGYSCPKGRALPAQHNDPNRLLHGLKRRGAAFARIGAGDAVVEVAAKVRELI